MSSEYYAVCLNHDPALALYAPEWGNYPEAEAAIAARPSGPFANHPDCDLVIARSSGNFIEIGCPRSEICRYHRDTVWVDVAWLRLYGAALGVIDTTRFHIPLCWSEKRVRSLAPLLEAAYTSAEEEL